MLFFINKYKLALIAFFICIVGFAAFMLFINLNSSKIPTKGVFILQIGQKSSFIGGHKI